MRKRLGAFFGATLFLAACDVDDQPGEDPRDGAAIDPTATHPPAGSGPTELHSSDDIPTSEGLISCLVCSLLGGSSPVCAGDGVTYSNACLANCHGDYIWHAGPCQCGNGIQTPGEDCDDGTGNGPNQACRAGCLVNKCGDGDKGPAEQCDDGNLAGGDGCSPLCNDEFCGNNIVDPGEQCDDGDDDGCADDCTFVD